MLQRSTVERVKHSVAGAVSSGSAAVSLAALAIMERLAAKSALVYTSLIGAGERQPIVLKLAHGSGGLATHVLDGVLVSKPVTAFDGVVRVPAPVVLCHVAKGGVDATLCSNGVRSSREELGNARGAET